MVVSLSKAFLGVNTNRERTIIIEHSRQREESGREKNHTRREVSYKERTIREHSNTDSIGSEKSSRCCLPLDEKKNKHAGKQHLPIFFASGEYNRL